MGPWTCRPSDQVLRHHDARGRAPAADAGAWAVGCILWAGSPRACEPGEAARIAAALRRRVEVCGVFVNAPLDEVAGLADGLGLTMVQLHGDEGPAFCGEVARRTGAKVIKATRVARGRRPARHRGLPHATSICSTRTRRAARGHGRDLRLGARAPAALGGPADPQRRADAGQRRRRRSPRSTRSPSTSPRGTEAAPGVKDPAKLAAFAAPSARPCRPRAEPRAMTRPSSTASAPTAASTSPRRSCRRWPSSRRPGSQARDDTGFRGELDGLLRDYVGRPSPLYLAAAAVARSPGARSSSSARTSTTRARTRSTTRSARRCSPGGWASARIIAETGAGQHGVATATACALLDLECVVYMGAEDVRRQQPNVQRMELLGATRLARRRRRADAQGGRLGGDPRLGDERRRHALHHRLRRRPRALPRAWCATCSASSATRPGPRCSSGRAGCPTASRLRRRRLERDRDLRRLRRRRRRRARRRRGGGRGPRRPAATARRSPSAAGRASCTAPSASCRTSEARSSRRTRSRPGSTTRAPAPSTPSCATAAARATSP